MNSVFPIVLGCDNNYFKYGLVTLQSLIVHAKTPEISYHIYFLHEDISSDNQALAKSLVQHLDNVSLEFITLTDLKNYQVYCDNSIGYINESTYYRMFIPKVFPQYDQILYLDCDLIVNFDVGKALVNFDFQDKILAAVTDKYIMYILREQERKMSDHELLEAKTPITNEPQHDWSDFNPKYYYQRIKVPQLGDYFNAGVLLFNLKKIRKLQLTENFISVINELERPIFRDQDLLNYLAYQHGGIYHLDRCFNFCFRDRGRVLSLVEYQGTQHYRSYHKMSMRKLKRHVFKKQHMVNMFSEYWTKLPFVFHFLSDEKPWLYYYSAADKYIWWTYARMLPEQAYQQLLTSSKTQFRPAEREFLATMAKKLATV